MSVVVDTTVLIDHLRGLEAASHFLERLERQPTCSEITRVEVVRGLRSGERRRALQLFALFRWLPLTTELAEAAGELGRRWRRSHHSIDTPDLVVAATARAADLVVATTNVRHFPMFEGLVPAYA